MSFQPPRCPYEKCEGHRKPPPKFRRWGSFHPACRDEPVPRFRCPKCRRTFSRQTFRHDYRDRRPETNDRLFELLTSGVGLRQSARVLGLGWTTVQKKMRKLGRTCRLLHDNLATKLPEGRAWLLDEEESYAGASIRPLTVPILMERESWFVVATGAAPIRRLAQRGTARRRRQDAEERRRGQRSDRSRACVLSTMRQLARRTSGPLEFYTDEKSSYRTLAIQVFGDRITHVTTSGSAPRTTHNRLFPINVTIAMSRDNCGRLRRRSWLGSKKRRWLKAQLAIFTVYRNYVRRRFNEDRKDQASACFLGLLERRLVPNDVVRWRQDWGERSIHPQSTTGGRTVS